MIHKEKGISLAQIVVGVIIALVLGTVVALNVVSYIEDARLASELREVEEVKLRVLAGEEIEYEEEKIENLKEEVRQVLGYHESKGTNLNNVLFKNEVREVEGKVYVGDLNVRKTKMTEYLEEKEEFDTDKISLQGVSYMGSKYYRLIEDGGVEQHVSGPSVNISDLTGGKVWEVKKGEGLSVDDVVLQAGDGDVIHLGDGEYVLTNANNNKSLTFVGQKDKTVLKIERNYFTGDNTVKMFHLRVDYSKDLYSMARDLSNFEGYNVHLHTDGTAGPFYSISYVKGMNVKLEDTSVHVGSLEGDNIVFYGEELNAQIKNTETNVEDWYVNRDHWRIGSISVINSFDGQNTELGVRSDKENVGVYGGKYAW